MTSKTDEGLAYDIGGHVYKRPDDRIEIDYPAITSLIKEHTADLQRQLDEARSVADAYWRALERLALEC